MLSAACSSSGDDLGGLQQSLEDRMTDALEFDSDEIQDGAPPAGEAGESAPQLKSADVPGGMAINTGFVITLVGDYEDAAAIKKAVVFVYGASRHILVDVLAFEDNGAIRLDMVGRLGSDEKLVGEKFTFKLALQNDEGVTGQYVEIELTIAEAVQDETLEKVNLFDDEYHESGRPEGSMSETAPQIDSFTYPVEIIPGGNFRLNLRTSFYKPELIKSAIMSTPHSPGYREYFTEAVTISGKQMSDSMVVVEGSFSEELDIGAELVFIIALRQDNGETGMYRSFRVNVVEESTDGDEEGAAGDFDVESDGDIPTDGDNSPDGDLESADVSEYDLDADDDAIENTDEDLVEAEVVMSFVTCFIHVGVAGAALEMQVGLQNIDEPVWSQNMAHILNFVSQMDSGGYITHKYALEDVPPGHYRAVVLIKTVAGSEYFFPDNFYWAVEGPELITGGTENEFNIWAGVSADLGVVEKINVEIDPGVTPGTNYVPHVFAVLTNMVPESLDLAMKNVIALRRVAAEANGYVVELDSIPPGTYFVSMWIDRCAAEEYTDDVFHFDWFPSIVVPQPVPVSNPILPLDLLELNCPLAPAIINVPAATDLGGVPVTGGMKSLIVNNGGSQAVLLMNQASTDPFYSSTTVGFPYILNIGAAWTANVSIGANPAGSYSGTFYLLVNDLMHPVYTSTLSAIMVK